MTCVPQQSPTFATNIIIIDKNLDVHSYRFKFCSTAIEQHCVNVVVLSNAERASVIWAMIFFIYCKNKQSVLTTNGIQLKWTQSSIGLTDSDSILMVYLMQQLYVPQLVISSCINYINWRAKGAPHKSWSILASTTTHLQSVWSKTPLCRWVSVNSIELSVLSSWRMVRTCGPG